MNIHSQNNIFYKIYLIGFIIILALPILNWPIYFSPPNWAKTLVFQIVFSFILFVFLCQILWQRNTGFFDKVRKISKENLVFWLLVLLFATHFLSTIFSVDFHYSFFGSPYRGGGFISYGFYILFAITAFLIIKKKDWKKLWNVAIGVGVIVCILALFSRFGLFSNFLITRIDNLSSTIGGPNTLGLYVMLLVFPALSFGLQVKNNIKRGLYLITSALFSFIVLLTISQGAYLGLAMGAIYFLIFFPTKSFTEKTRRKIFYGKIAIVTVAALLFFSVIIIKSNPDYTLNDHYLFKQLTTWKVDKSRLATWQVSFDAFLDRPLLGYGPENFSIGFDRNYDPTLSSIQMDRDTPASWWDKAHNFALNLLVETGIIGFISFILLFGLVFWQLHKITHKKIDNTKQLVNDPPNPIITHGLQAAFIAYFTNLMFNFENFSSYILAFLIVGYAMSFTIPETPKTAFKDAQHSNLQRVQRLFVKNKKAVAGVAFVFLAGFIWFFNVKPFNANAQINKAAFLANNKMCGQAMAILDKELKKHTIFDGYLRIKYIDTIKRCIQLYPENDVALAQKAIPILEENVKIMPHYTRNWLIMVAFNNIIAVTEQDPVKKSAIFDHNREFLRKAEELSPNRHEVLVEIINLAIFEGDYESARQISQDCTKQYPEFNACYWYLGLSQIYLSKNDTSLQEGKKNMEKAQAMGYSQLSQYSLTQLAFLYISKENYKELEWVYENLAETRPPNPRYFAGLALVYKRNGKLKESTEALKEVLRIQSNAQSIERGQTETQGTITLLIENILGIQETNPKYHLSLYNLYLQMANEEERDSTKAMLYKEKAEEEYNLSRQQ